MTPIPHQLKKGIEFCHVSFSYPGTSYTVLSDLNFHVPAGKCVAFVGQNGAGKTTIIKLLARLYIPTQGKILIDEIPIEAYDLDSLRKHISIIFQDFIRYELTVRENIGFGKAEDLHDVRAIQEAGEKSLANEFIVSFPQEYDTMLGRMFESGRQLSGGQWQKIALARAFIRNAPIVVLDEPTASIDAEAEAEIFGRLHHIVQGATTFLIAHRFSTVRIADHIIVLEQGKLIEEGTHEDLMLLNKTYAHLFQLQAAGYNNSPIQ